jgi:hypothetical protein
LAETSDRDELWDPPLGIPEAEDIGPALDEAEITAWEVQHGVRLPAILHRAYRQQDGGRVRDSERGAALVRLQDFHPWDVRELDMTYANADGRFSTGRLFDIGYDDTGANILLHYPDKDGAEPAAYFHYNDGGTVEEAGTTVNDLWVSVSR